MQRRERTPWRVGALVVVATSVLAVGILLIGNQNNLFRRMNRYTVQFQDIKGLQDGSPVQLNGVSVGRVEKVALSPDPAVRAIAVRIAVDRRYGNLVRQDSQVRIKTLGLLGDKFIEITAGSAGAAPVENGGEIQAGRQPDVESLINSGGDVVDNVVAISASLTKILDRLEKGEGVLGQLLGPIPEADKDLSLVSSLRKATGALDRITLALEGGKSPMSRLLIDEQMGAQLAGSVARLDRWMVEAEQGQGLVPSLVFDPTLKDQVGRTLANLEQTSVRLAKLSENLDKNEGLLPRLVNDEEYARRVTGELEEMVVRLNKVAGALERGEGTAGKLIMDPSIYDAVNDVVIGINESKMLRWLIRNRQKAGIKKRYQDATKEPGAAPAGPVPEAAPPEN
jgi:phospholipid/cholesterol/gamma-HCH transport system substrate-binding protein